MVKAFVAEAADYHAVSRRLRAAVAAVSVAPVAEVGMIPLRAEDWRTSWRRHFRVQRVGRGVVVRPWWRRYVPRPGETVIKLEPGMAFGTGQHPTTRLCLRAVAELLRPGQRVLDLGTGSGILAVAAALRGARSVLALDPDPQAVQAARSNARRNGVAGRVRALEGDIGRARGRFDLILANISASVLTHQAEQLAARLAPDGRLVASGFLAGSTPAVRAAFRAAGLRPRRSLRQGEWRALVAEAI